ncbi:MAG: apolipoprotein N-acyltransferase [Magnetococcales bacterium]|nr:apolipoprotein N-acyltransferase [Magnetococcales bacterium]
MKPDLSTRRIARWLRRRSVGGLLLAFLAGAVSMGGFAPSATPWPTIVGLGIWLRLLEGTTPKRGAWLGFVFGLGHFIPGLTWLWTSLHLYGKIPAVAVGLMIVGLAAILAGYPALFGALLPRLVYRPAWVLVAAPALWVVTEWLRAHVLSGFPWNLIGYVWESADTVVQIADLGGVYLLSGLTLFLAALVSRLARQEVWHTWKTPLATVTVGLLVFGSAWSYGRWRIQDLDATMIREQHPALRVALVQGNIAQDLKWDPKRQKEWLNRYLDLSSGLDSPVDLVVWPETAAAFFLQAAPQELESIVQVSRALHAPIVTGAPMADKDENKEWRFYNSMVWIDAQESGDFLHRYDKHHLVPFGEYIPFRRLVPGSLQKLTHGAKDFSAGPGPKRLDFPKGALGPLICYEVIFPDEVRELAMQGVSWLVNITNDGWFGEAAKPQHLAMARLRAVENRLPMVRVANSGISAVYDALGREKGRIPSNAQGALVVAVPPKVGESFWSRHGQWGIGVWGGLCLLLWGGTRRARRVPPPASL